MGSTHGQQVHRDDPRYHRHPDNGGIPGDDLNARGPNTDPWWCQTADLPDRPPKDYFGDGGPLSTDEERNVEVQWDRDNNCCIPARPRCPAESQSYLVSRPFSPRARPTTHTPVFADLLNKEPPVVVSGETTPNQVRQKTPESRKVLPTMVGIAANVGGLDRDVITSPITVGIVKTLEVSQKRLLPPLLQRMPQGVWEDWPRKLLLRWLELRLKQQSA